MTTLLILISPFMLAIAFGLVDNWRKERYWHKVSDSLNTRHMIYKDFPHV